MPLNPQIEALLGAMAEMEMPSFPEATPEQVRALNDNPMFDAEGLTLARVEDIDLALEGRRVPARLYVPEGTAADVALTLFYHGGGWVVGTLDTHDALCRQLARESGSAVLSVGYRLAPEHPFPAGLDDCYDALAWAAANGKALGVDTTRLAVAGDSAGGNLAAAVAIRARDESGPPLRHQLLIYPVTDNDFTLSSYAEHGQNGGFLSTAMMQWFWDHYVGPRNSGHVPLATVHRTEDLAGLPPATVITAEFDPLRDEGMAYAARLAGAGVPTEAEIAPGMIHGFASMFSAVPDALPYLDRASARLREALA
ncbi:alpha/beta hydrolase [Novosphingobium sp. KN65.2]|uniref:alpha/beta hydrolase n=1 Tax=Novosphingobium sp. KN65.2 TaxID=1478134 RepID=UPI0005E431C7|nr:alpha/beta hydrolase [Novosphingobium sp. KN65.2]CDO34478.1 Alpha/beta hydrolase fold-3 domain protein [Novosphingobium sp. KN65.2]